MIHRLEGIRGHLHGHTNELAVPLSQADLDALNAVQATAWRVNSWVLDVMSAAWSIGLRIGGLEVGEPLSIPPRLPEDQWVLTSDADKKKHIALLRKLHGENASMTGKSQAVLDNLSVATELRDRPAIYFPHTKDFRHRIYPAVTRGPNPQGSDISKSLLMFAEGKPLGEDGLFWLYIRAANCYGYDKATLE